MFELQGTRDEGKGHKERKLEEMGTETVILADWHRASLSLQQDGAVGEKKSQLQVQRKQLSITLVKDGLITEATLHVSPLFESILSCFPFTIGTKVLSSFHLHQEIKLKNNGNGNSCIFKFWR